MIAASFWWLEFLDGAAVGFVVVVMAATLLAGHILKGRDDDDS